MSKQRGTLLKKALSYVVGSEDWLDWTWTTVTGPG